MTIKLNAAEVRALTYLRSVGDDVPPRAVAAAVWPASPGWKRDRRGVRGTSITMRAGQLLRGLAKRKLVDVSSTLAGEHRYSITPLGEEVLDA